MARKGYAPSGWQVKGRLDGVEQAVKSLKGLSQAVERRVLRKATTKGAQPIARAAKQTVPRESGQYRRAVGYRVWTGRKSGLVAAFIGARLGFKTMYKGKPRDPRYYAHLVERGRRALKPKRKKVLAHVPADRGQTQLVTWYGKHVRAAAPQRPLARAFKQAKGVAEQAMVAAIGQGVAQEAAKLAAKAK